MGSALYVDINCDLGEGNTFQDCVKDALLMPHISSCNIACGGHAGSDFTIRESLKNASIHKLKIGAHPGYPDKENFGRKSINLSFRKLEQTLLSQMYFLLEIAEQEQTSVSYIKFHGALYNDIENNNQLAFDTANTLMHFFPLLKVAGLAGGKLEDACKKLGLNFLAEGFIDRTYLSNGKLTPRTESNAIIEDHDTSVDQAIALASNQPVLTSDNHKILRSVDTICLHSDNPGALPLIKKIKIAFDAYGIIIR